MNKKTRGALQIVLHKLQTNCPKGVLTYGKHTGTGQTFCQPVNISKAGARLQSCANLEIRALGYYHEIEGQFVEWFKAHIRLPPDSAWTHLADPTQWLKINVSGNLFCLHLWSQQTHYYILLRAEMITQFRAHAFT